MNTVFDKRTLFNPDIWGNSECWFSIVKYANKNLKNNQKQHHLEVPMNHQVQVTGATLCVKLWCWLSKNCISVCYCPSVHQLSGLSILFISFYLKKIMLLLHLIFGLNLPNLAILGGCPLKILTFEKKIVSYCLWRCKWWNQFTSWILERRWRLS